MGDFAYSRGRIAGRQGDDACPYRGLNEGSRKLARDWWAGYAEGKRTRSSSLWAMLSQLARQQDISIWTLRSRYRMGDRGGRLVRPISKFSLCDLSKERRREIGRMGARALAEKRACQMGAA